MTDNIDTPRIYGPAALTRLDLMGIRLFAAPAGGDDDGGDDDDDDTDDSQEENSQDGDDTEGDDNEQDSNDDDDFDVEKARKKLAKVNSENRNLRARAKKAEAAAKDAGPEKVTALEADNLRLRVALKYGLPEKIAKRLTGSTEEELLADAEELLELTGTGKKPPTNQPRERLRGGGDPTRDSSADDELADPDKFAESVFRN